METLGKNIKNEPDFGSDLLARLKKLSLLQTFSIVSMFLISLTIPVTIFMAVSPKNTVITPAKEIVTPNVSPTPEIIGHAPVIMTTQLNDADLNKNYKVSVEGYDEDLGDELTFQATGLPSGISLEQCQTNSAKIDGVSENEVNHLSCMLSGKTEEFGEFNVTLTLIDGFNFVQKTLPIKVK